MKDQRRKRKFKEAKTQKEAEFKMANITSLSFMTTCNTAYDESINNPKKYLIKTYFLLLKFVCPEIKKHEKTASSD